MANVISSNFRCANALNFTNLVAASSVYSFIGRTYSWDFDSSFSDTNPPSPVDSSDSTNLSQLKEAVAMKKVQSTDVCLAVRRIDWQSGTVYEKYSLTDKDILRKDFYVLTDEGRVYKCIDNNNNAASISKPTAMSSEVFSTADSYKWKYMYSIVSADKFLTPKYVYCPRESINSNVDSVNSVTNMPPGGHASNIPRELGAFYVIVSCNYVGSEGGALPVDIDYRTYGLVSNPVEASTNNIAIGNFYKMSSRARFSAGLSGTISVGEQVLVQPSSGPSFNAYVVATGTESGQVFVDLVGNPTEITIGSLVSSGSISGTVTNVVACPISKTKGSVLCYEHRTPILRAADQTEALNIVLEF